MSRRKTPEERRLSGYYRPSRHGTITPLFPSQPEAEACPLPDQPPEYLRLSEGQLAHWRSAARQAPWLRAGDAGLVAIWAVHVDIFETAMIGRNRAEEDGDREAAAAYAKILDREGAIVFKAAKLLGFGPVALQRLGAGQ